MSRPINQDDLFAQIASLERRLAVVEASVIKHGIELIESYTLTASATSFDFLTNPLPQTYQSLMLVSASRTDAASHGTYLRWRFNGDTGNNYADSTHEANGSTDSNFQINSNSESRFGYSTGSSVAKRSSCVTILTGYASSAYAKTWISLIGSAINIVADNIYNIGLAGHWANTAPITRITVLQSTGNILAGSRFDLYGLVGR